MSCTLVSILTPVFNSEYFLRETIESVLCQTYTNWELILIDDGSTDKSLDIINSYVISDRRIKLIKLENNSGVVNARNIGIKCAKGRYIAFLDSDDVWLSNKLELQVDHINKYNCIFVFSDYHVINHYGKIIYTRSCPTHLCYEDLLRGNSVGMLTGLYDRLKNNNIYFEEVGWEDYQFWLNLLKNKGFARGIKIPLAKYRVHDGSLSSFKIKSAYKTWRTYRDGQGIPFFKSIFFMIFYLTKGIIKRIY